MTQRNVQYRVAWPPFTPSIIALGVAFFVLWLGSVLIEPFGTLVAAHLVLQAATVTREYAVWTFFTYAFFHFDFVNVVFTAFALWVFGAELQSRWSTAKWWGVQLAAIILGGLVTFGLLWIFNSPLPVRGYSAPVMALVTAYCWLYWKQKLNFFFFEMTGRTMLVFFLALSVVLSALSGYWPGVALDLSGVVVGLLASTRTLNPRDLRVRLRNWRMRRKLKVVRSPEDKPNPRKTPDGQYIN